MEIQFDPHQPYQKDAIDSIVNLFEGQPPEEAIDRFNLIEGGALSLIQGVANQLIISDSLVLDNLKAVQEKNEIPVSDRLEGLNFTVEMETGTGKTYVYLRTIYELNKVYGFKKFVIVVPSVAIREGTLKNLSITHEHFQNLYDNTPVNYQVYDSTKVSQLRGFATENSIQILVMNIDAFAKDENIINKPNDKLTGQRPIEFIQATKPFVIVDEPQNMETKNRKKAIDSLNPLCTLRYSATHKNLYNLVYSLNPVKAYDLGLVKQIEVDSVISEDSDNDAFVALEQVKSTKTKVYAKMKINVNSAEGVKKKSVKVQVGDDLYPISNEREIYNDGYIVEGIDVEEGFITFTNGCLLRKGTTQGGLTDQVKKMQMEKTIEEHFRKERHLSAKGFKVLSLFFIDKVANYRSYNETGEVVPGKFAEWFKELYEKHAGMKINAALPKLAVQDVHNGYFSQDKKGQFKDSREGKESLADQDTFKLIMQDKERLLDISTPLRFIFSHSALREGWDNPNVFQICTLNESKSEIKKRQEIGRGLRLAVDKDGLRSYDRNINRLTVVANEAYEDFAKALQKEIEDDFGISFTGRIKNKRLREKVEYRKGFLADPKFLEIWDRIKHQTTYKVEYKTEDLIESGSKALKEMPKITPQVIVSTRTGMRLDSKGVEGDLKSVTKRYVDLEGFQMPDILAYIQNRTELTRFTILAILKQSERLSDVLVNPQMFMDYAIAAIRSTMNELMIKGIKYEKVGGAEFEMRLFENHELETYLDSFHHVVSDPDKTIYTNYIPLDSGTETDFAKDCETSEQVEFFFKLPYWFKIPTPIGTYNPDWAVIFNGEKRVYFVTETKSTNDLTKLRPDERQKIACGRRHYEVFKDVDYRMATRLSDLSAIE